MAKAGWGALELAARYSYLNLNDGLAYQGGDETNYTLGLNWYATPTIRVMGNYIWVNSSRRGISTNPSLFQLRGQVDF